MIQSFREKISGIIAIAIIILIAIPLAFFGVDSLFFGANRVSNIGSVNGKDISEGEFAIAVDARESQIRQMLGGSYSPGPEDSALIQSAALSELVNIYLYLTHAEDSSMGMTEQYVARQIQQVPLFQINGEFSDSLFSNYISRYGYTANTYISQTGDELLSNQLRVALGTSVIATQQSLEKTIAISQETRSYQTLLLPVDTVLETVEVSDLEIEEYYAENAPSFMLPERVSLEYVQLSASDFIDDVEVSEAEIEARFALVLAGQPTRRQAAHILVEIEAGDAHFAVLDELQQKIEEGVEFAELAAEYSDDIGSSGSGGVLGYTDGASFPAEFEAALAELEVGEVSGPVLTDAGFHVIKLLNVDQEEIDLADEYAGLQAEIQLEKAGDIYQENVQNFTDVAFSSEDMTELVAGFSSIKPLELKNTELFDRQSGGGVAASETLRALAFSENILEKGWIEVIELDSTQIAVRLSERVESGVAPLEEVRDQIVGVLTRNKGTALLAERAEALQARIEGGEEVEDVARDESIEWQVQLDALRGTGGSVGEAIFAAPISGALPIVGADIQANGDYIIYSIDEVSAGSLDDYNDTQLSQLTTQLSQFLSTAENKAYLDTLRSNADIDFKIDVEIQ